ncbi:hypothetical protein C8J56DRAFT_899846 [Mycena floridula]|nr:hypothetical protein C8J56DRAFT_904004 [Mycena floridula]KAJ7575665.1 hypothetical protein C8J56DRAFT_900967 [Mycena floridula]KAJ7576316.1 hypothetical protein C8J56DRAFT_899846 [Mycena floridula]
MRLGQTGPTQAPLSDQIKSRSQAVGISRTESERVSGDSATCRSAHVSHLHDHVFSQRKCESRGIVSARHRPQLKITSVVVTVSKSDIARLRARRLTVTTVIVTLAFSPYGGGVHSTIYGGQEFLDHPNSMSATAVMGKAEPPNLDNTAKN